MINLTKPIYKYFTNWQKLYDLNSATKKDYITYFRYHMEQLYGIKIDCFSDMIIYKIIDEEKAYLFKLKYI